MALDERVATPGLPRRLGLWPALGLVVGITIGSGIFRTPAAVATRVPDPPLMLAVWLVAGLMSLCGALSVAELAASLPRSGGWYVFIRESWGRPAGFLFGWTELVLIRASATGALAIVFGSYLLRFLGYDPETYGLTARAIAAAAIATSAAANIRGIRIGAALAGISSLTKVTALALLVAAAVILGGAHGASVSHFSPSTADVHPGMFGLALISALWAFDGFADVSFAAGEVIDPQRTLPRAIVGGLLAIAVVYLAATCAYLYVLPIADLARSPLVAADTMRAIAGGPGASLVSIVIAVSTFGSLAGIMLAAPRIFFAMAEERLFFRSMTRVHPRFQTPHVAIALTASLGVLFVLTRTFEQLADTFVLSIWPFYGLAVAGLYRLRRLRPELPRPFRTPGYPVVPAVFVGSAVFLVGNALMSDPLWAGVTFAIVLAGLPVYYAVFRARPE
jgi:amino acid transporter